VIGVTKKYFVAAATLAALFLPATQVFASTTGNLLPTADGNMKQFTPSSGISHFALVDETPCNGTTDYNSTTVAGNRDAYTVSITSVPDGAAISKIEIKPCASQSASGNPTPVMNVYYRFGGATSTDSGSYSLSGTTPTELASTTYSNLSFIKSATTTLDIGAVLTSGTKGVRLSRISTIVTYTAITAPTTLTATATTTSTIGLSWTDTASTTENGFSIERSPDGSAWSALATTSKGVVSYYDSSLTASTTYYYRVRAFNYAAYTSFSNTASATTSLGVPAAPSALAATATTTSAIALSWTDNATTTELGFSIERSLNGSTWGALATTSQGVTLYYDSGLMGSTGYYYRVRAFNSVGYSAFSNTASATTTYTTISSNITTDTTWSPSGGVYYISTGVDIQSGVTLTIASGTIIKVANHAYALGVLSGGVLNIEGTTDSPVYITSYKDDTVGGDTNGDGTSSSPAAGDWDRIENVGTTTIQHAVVRYGGWNGFGEFNVTSNGYLDIENSTLSKSRYDIIHSGARVIIENTDIYDYSTQGIFIYGGTFDIASSSVHGGTDGIWLNAISDRAYIRSSDIYSNSNSGITANFVTVAVDGSSVRNNTTYGIYLSGASGATTTVQSSNVHHNAYGIYANNNTPYVQSNAIHDNSNYGVYNNSAYTLPAEYNYWGSALGPISTTTSAAPRDAVNTNVDYDPWSASQYHVLQLSYIAANATTSSMEYFASTTFSSALTNAVATWNNLDPIVITATTSANTADVMITDVYVVDLTWDGLYCPILAEGDDCDPMNPDIINIIYLNRYNIDGDGNSPPYIAPEIQHVITHEIGHALGLAHSHALGNIMDTPMVPDSQTSLGSQDIIDYRYLYPNL
jgi:hypothetical protein